MRGLSWTSMKKPSTTLHLPWRTKELLHLTRSFRSTRTIRQPHQTHPRGHWRSSTRTTVRPRLPTPTKSKSRHSTSGGWSRTPPRVWLNPQTATWTKVQPSTRTTRRPRYRARPNTQGQPTATWSSNTRTRRRQRSRDRLKWQCRSTTSRRCPTRSRRAVGVLWLESASASATSSLQTRRTSRTRMPSWTGRQWTMARKRAGVQMHQGRHNLA